MAGKGFAKGWRLLAGGLVLALAAGQAVQTVAAAPVDYLRIHRDVLGGDFAAVDRALAKVEERYRKGEVGDGRVSSAYGAFATTHPGFARQLDAWVRQRPESHRPRLARGRYLTNRAYLARGAAYADETREAQFQAMNRHMDRAVKDLRKALELRPDLTVAYANLVRIAKARAPAEKTLRIARQGLEHDPGSFNIRSDLLYALQPKWGGSVDAIRRVIADMAPHIEAHPKLERLRGFVPFVFAERLARDGRTGSAIDYLDEAMQWGPLPLYLRERARAYSRQGNHRAALRDIDRALEMRPQSAYYLRRRGDVLREMGRKEKALAAYQASLRLDPRNPEAAYGQAEVLEDLERYQAAAASFRVAAVYGGHDEDVHLQWGWLLSQRLGQPEKGVRKLKKARKLAPERPEILYFLARAEYKTQDCAIIGHMEEYLEMCNSGSDCRGDRMKSVKASLDSFERHGTCS